MKFNEFVNRMKNQGGIDKDGMYGKQCMDLFNYYCVQVLGMQDGKTGATCAKKILNNSYVMQNVTRINNTPSFVPQKGDIAVWTSGNYGHVAICLGKGDVNSFRSLDQNWKAQQLTEENHNYTYLAPIVFLRPKNQSNIVEPVQNNSGRITQNGTFTASVNNLNVRRSPSLNGQVVAQYNKGESVKYDSYIDSEGYRWVSYIGKSGNRNYIARRKLDNSQVFGTCR